MSVNTTYNHLYSTILLNISLYVNQALMFSVWCGHTLEHSMFSEKIKPKTAQIHYCNMYLWLVDNYLG